jgi:RNA polymerase sigma-70 factor (ECF subfamily)
MAPDRITDEAMICACNEGGPGAEQAFAALYDRHKDYVHRLALRFTGSADLALDAMQETFAYLLRKFPPPPENRFVLTAKMTTFLYPVVKHNSLEAKRKQRRMGQEPVGFEVDGRAAETNPLRGNMENDDLRGVLGRLSEDHREVIWLRFVEDLSLLEIAERVGVPEGTVKSRLHHAIKQLRADPGVARFFGAE